LKYDFSFTQLKIILLHYDSIVVPIYTSERPFSRLKPFKREIKSRITYFPIKHSQCFRFIRDTMS